MNTKILILLLAASSACAQIYISTSLPEDFSIAPSSTDGFGNSARRDSGGFLKNPSQHYEHLVYWIGTNLTAGSLILDYSTPFTDGVGYDFALTTGSEVWGALASTASLSFYFGGTLLAYIDDFSLTSGATYAFEMPGDGLIVSRVVITNTTPDPSGINDLATMEFIDAGAAYVSSVPEPAMTAAAVGFFALLLGVVPWRSKLRRNSLIAVLSSSLSVW